MKNFNYVIPNGFVLVPGSQWHYVDIGGNVFSARSGKYTGMSLDRQGYKITMFFYNNKQRRCFVHRLIALTFIPNPNDLPQVNHKDGNKKNNHVSNLEWCTCAHNIQHAIRTGLKASTGITQHLRDLNIGECFTVNITKRKPIDSYIHRLRVAEGIEFSFRGGVITRIK